MGNIILTITDGNITLTNNGVILINRENLSDISSDDIIEKLRFFVRDYL